jgi:hydroxypyruvate isomerase
MNRRQFSTALGSALLGAAVVPRSSPAGKPANSPQNAAPKFSVMLWTVFEKLPFEQRLEKVAEAGYHAVELVGEFKKWSAQDFTRANARKKSLGIIFDATAGIDTPLTDPSQRQAFLDEVNRMLPAMEKLECSSLIVLSGNRVGNLSSKDQHQSCVEGLKRAAEIAERAKINILLENIDPEENPEYFLTSSREGFDIIREVNHPRVKFLYDLYHEQISEGNLIAKLEKNIDQIGLIHVADVPGRHEPGTGEISYPNIFRKLAALKYDRYIAMEFLPTRDPVQSLRAAREGAVAAWEGTPNENRSGDSN